MSDSPTKYEPNKTQQALVVAAWALDWDFTVESLCRQAGFETRDPYYDAVKHADFREYWLSESLRWCALQAPKVRMAVIKAATGDAKGNSTDRRTYLDGFDKHFVPRSRAEIEHSGGVALITNVSVKPAQPKEFTHDDGE